MKKPIGLGAAVALLWVGNAQAGFLPFASDTLTWDPSEAELEGQGDWAAPGTSFAYTVNEGTGPDAGSWEYNYNLNVAQKDISHLIIEVSPSFTEDNIISDSESTTPGAMRESPKTHQPSATDGNPNPGMPDELFGIKWDLQQDSTSFATSFQSDRSPIWGDFFSKGGRESGRGPDRDFNSIWNAGFTSSDLDPDFNGPNALVDDHILVPDTTTPGGGGQQPVPEPGTLALIGLGLLGMQSWLLRRKEWPSA